MGRREATLSNRPLCVGIGYLGARGGGGWSVCVWSHTTGRPYPSRSLFFMLPMAGWSAPLQSASFRENGSFGECAFPAYSRLFCDILYALDKSPASMGDRLPGDPPPYGGIGVLGEGVSEKGPIWGQFLAIQKNTHQYNIHTVFLKQKPDGRLPRRGLQGRCPRMKNHPEPLVGCTQAFHPPHRVLKGVPVVQRSWGEPFRGVDGGSE